MQRGRKIASVIMLVVFATSNLFESFSYVFAQEENFETENQITVSETSDEGNNSDGDTAEDNFSDDETVDDETADDETADNETENGAIVEPISSTIAGETDPTPETGNSETLPIPETGNNETLPIPETGNNETLPTPETGNNETLPTPETGNNETLPTPETGNNETLPTPETGNNETLPTPETGSVIDDEMDIYDFVYTGVVEGKRYTITLMDRNLGAESNDKDGEESYGRYYQWGNNYPFSHHTQLNHYTNERVDASGYGPNNRFRGENFIKGSNDWSTVSNDNLWGGEGDNEENDYYDIDANRQGPCPDGYHVPSVGEWYALLSSFLANNGLDLASTSGLSYSDYIGKERKAAYYLDSEYIENFKEIFNISYAGRIINGTLQRTGETAHLWTSTPLNGGSLGFEVWDDHINLGGWKTVRTTGYPIRCFKSVEYELIDYTITYVDEGEVTTEIKHWGDILTEPEHTEKGTGYNRLGWYSRGLKFNFDTPVTGDLTLVSTWGCAEGYHLTGGQCESNIKVVDCIQTGGVENSKYIVTGSTITWDITGAKREEIPVCEWTCLDNYHLTGTQLTGGQLTGVKCESNTKIVDCIQTGKVENSTYILSGVEITWDITGAKRNETPACEWVCNQHYHLNGDECAIDTFQFILQGNVNVDTSSSTQPGKKPYNSRVELNAVVNTGYRFMGWQILGLEGSGSSSTTIDSQVVFNMPDREVVATPLSEIIEYKIVYKNVDDTVVDNPDTYTIETPTFTLNEPVKTGYTFLGWTGSNGLDPEKNIIITKGNYGNKKYSAVWQANTGVKYEVVHALEKANTTSYEEVDTEILSGTTDEMTEAVAKEYTGFTAKEIEQRIIKGDGSTVVRIMYDRNIYTITFDTDGGSEILPMTGKYGSNLTAPSEPTKGGYIFNGWSPVFPTTMPLGGAELLAQWRRRSGGGSSSSEETQVTTGTNETMTGQTNTGKVEEVVNEVENLDVDAGISGAPVINRPMKLGSVMLKALAQPQTKSAGGSATLLHGTGFNIMIKTLAGDSSPAYNSINTTITQVLQASSIPSGVDTGVVSAEDSESEIVAWFDNGTIYYYTDAGTIHMNENSSYMFAGCSGLTGLDLSSWNTENVTTMYQIFGGCSNLENLNLDNWTINGSSNTIGGMFGGVNNIKTLSLRNWTIPENFTNAIGCRVSQLCAASIDFVDVSNWNLSSTKNLNGVFASLQTKEIRGLNTWNTSGVTDMSNMFAGDAKLEGEINLSGWNTENVTTMYQIFGGCSNITGVNMSNIDLSNISNMQAMFQGDTELKKVNLSGITPKTFSVGGMFDGCSKLEELDLSNSDFSNVSFSNFVNSSVGYNLIRLNLSSSIFSGSMSNAFGGANKIEKIILSGVNVSNVTNMASLFNGDSKLTGLDLSSFDTSKVTSISDMFAGCSNLEELDLSNFDTSNVTTSMGRMFGGCNKLENLNMSGWDFSKMGSFDIMPMFWTSAGGLKKLDLTNAIFTGNLSFRSAPLLEEIKLDGVDTSNVTSMNELFRNDRNLTGLDLSSFDTSNVTNMSYMFEGCTGLTNLDLSSFDTSKVTNMGSMFYNMTNLKTIYVSTGFVTTAVTSSGTMFTNDTNLVGGNGTTYDANHTDAEYARIDGQNGLSGYFTKVITTTTLLPGKEFNATIKSLAAGTNVAYNVTGTTITKIVQTGSIPAGVTTGLLSTEDSAYPIYGWFAGGIIYYYTEADKIYMNEDSSYMFNRLTKLNNLNLNNWDTSRVTDMSYMFYYCSTLTSLSLGSWDTSKVTNMAYMFSFCSAATSWSFTSFDTSSVTNMTNMFYGASKMKTLNLSGWDTSNVTNMHSMFNSCNALTTLTISSFDTSKVTDMAYMFQNCKAITTLNLSHFDTSNVTNMSYMFNGCEKLANLNLSGWNTSNVTTMYQMFQNCKVITSLNLSHFDTSNVTTMYQMFYTCPKLANLNVSGWNTSNVTNMYRMFYGDSVLTVLNLSSWDTSKVTNMVSMFQGCSKLTTIYAGTSFVTTAVTSPATNSKNMFYGNSAIVGGNGTKYNGSYVNYTRAKIDKPGQAGYFTDASSAQLSAGTTFNATIKTLAGSAGATTGTENTNITKILQWTGNSIPSGVTTGLLSVSTSPYPVYGWYDNGTIYYYTEADNIYMNPNSSYMFYDLQRVKELDIETWNTTKVTNMAYMFGYCRDLESLDLSGWNTANVTTLQGTFLECSMLQSLNVSTWNTANVTNMNGTFYDVVNLESLDLSGWNTAKVTNMSEMFDECNALHSLDVSRWNTSNVTNMSSMFYNCESLESLGVSNWNTAKVTNMSNMFYHCSSLTGLDLSKWNTAKVTNMSNMFNNSTSLESLNVSNWDTSSVTDMSYMFTDCNSLTELNLGSNLTELNIGKWDTSSVTNSSNMFYACDALETIYASDKFVVSGSVNSSNMFGGCISLVGGNGTEFDENHIDGEYARIDGVNGLSGYFTQAGPKVIFDANGGTFSGGGETENVEGSIVEVYNKIYKYSHTENVDDNGVQQSNYDEDWNNSNIRGTDRTSAVNQAHVLTFPDSSGLTVDLYYNGESANYDWVSVRKGSYPDYTAASNYSSSGAVTTGDGGLSTNKYGGSQDGTFTVNGNTLTKMGHSTLIIPGNAVTFGFTSDDDDCGRGYGYYAVVEGEGNVVEGYQCEYDITAPTREGYFFDGWYTDTGYTQIFDTSASECLFANTTIYAKRYQPQLKDIILEATSTADNQTLKINKYFANGYKVYRGDGESENLTSDTTHTYSGAGTYTIVLSLSGADRWTFQNGSRPLVPTNGTSMTGVRIVSMPSLVEGFGNSAINPGNNFFSYFNSNGAITSLPEGSFRLSTGLTTVGNYFFYYFNNNGSLTSLPGGSFDTSNITSIGSYFFGDFNSNGAITSLSEGSFRLANGLTTVGSNFFQGFNYNGAITSLPEGSFDTSNITSVGNYFFGYFNNNGQLTSLPSGSFRLANGLTTVGSDFFQGFNYNGALTSLPEGSFDISNIMSIGTNFFNNFNHGGALTSLPEGSFRLSTGLTTVGNYFFNRFNSNGAITSLPEGSFDISNITSVGWDFFSYFNYNGAITSLPSGSFDTSNITSVGDNFFEGFNRDGALESLPEGSFDISNIMSAGYNSLHFFSYFNYNGAITSLPESFKLSSVAYDKTTTYMNSFNSPNYTLNRNVSDIVSGVTVPSSDTNMFSDNQPGRCGVHENWLVNPANGCDVTITFNTNGGSPISGMVTSAGGTIILPASSKTGYILDGWYTEQTGGTMVGREGDIYTGSSSTTLYAHREVDKRIIIQATATGANQTLKINKYFANAYTVDWGDGSPVETVSADKTHTYNTAGTYTITLSLTGSATRWTFKTNYVASFVPRNGTTVSNVKIIYMPSLADGFGNSETAPGNYFFFCFNYNGALTSLPPGSFDTSHIVTAGSGFFRSFTQSGILLTSLPTGSFDISNITTTQDEFFSHFNRNGVLTELPEGSFKLGTGLVATGYRFFYGFNYNGNLISLPEGSFNIENITSVGDEFFCNFNYNGKLTSLPEGSFRFSTGLTEVGDYFFANFNLSGQLINLPDGSFDTSNLTSVGNNTFRYFNGYGLLESLPDGSFDISNITTIGNEFFMYFNYYGALRSLPENSFRLSTGLTIVGNSFFNAFNHEGQLTNLPEGSFDTSNITLVGDSFFRQFNYSGDIESLPDGSFNISNISSHGNNFFRYFNGNGKITELPDSFTMKSMGTSGTNIYFNGFNSSSYTINKKVSDLVDGIDAPSSDMDTFSDNQPGRCGVHENWLVTTANACSITYDDGQGGTGQLKYDANTMSVAVGSGIIPARTGYMFLGWTNASGETINHVTFPEMDGQTIYAQWTEVYTITYNLNGGTESRTNPTTYTVESGTLWLYQPTKTGEVFLGWTGSNGSTPNANVYITKGSTGNRTYNAVWGEFEDIDAYFISDTGVVSNITLMDRNLGANTDDITSTGSYGFHYQWGNNNGFQIGCWTKNCSDKVSQNAITTRAVWESEYENKGYNKCVLIKGYSDYWTGNNHYNGLRGGSGDNESNNYGLETVTSSNIVNRQGPCPDGYHVPCAGEWGNVYEKLGLSSNTESITKLQRALNLPFAGYRNYSSNWVTLGLIGSAGRYWTSTPGNNDDAYTFSFEQSYVGKYDYNYRSYSRSVRCFSNDYLFTQPSMTIHPNGGTGAMILVEGGNVKSLGTPHRDSHSIFEGWYDAENGGNQIQTGSTAPTNLYARWSCDGTGFKDNGTECALNKDILLEVAATAGQKIKINKYFANAYTVDRGDGSPVETVSADKTHTYTGDGTYTITLSTTANRWTFTSVAKPLVPKDGTTVSNVKIIYMPSLADGFGANAGVPGNLFFYNFNYGGAITSLPDGSFDTSNITSAGDYFFYDFNYSGALINLPEGSFRFSTGLMAAGNRFFAQFNIYGQLTSLPEGSFNIENITSVGDDFFRNFNYNGKLTSLPEGSFRLSTGLTEVGGYFFGNFNTNGQLVKLSTGSFNTENITSVGNNFFGSFNYKGQLINLPEGSFKFSTGLKIVGNEFFRNFNNSGSLTSLPEGSFDTSNITTVGSGFFMMFNQKGQLTNLSTGSFNIENITSVGNNFFRNFNNNGLLTSLPDGSFRLSTGLTTVGDYFFGIFNSNGSLTSLPEGSFDTSNITTVGYGFFGQFNAFGKLTSLPEGSFDISSITTVGDDFFLVFNSDGSLTSLPKGSFILSTGLTTVGENFFRQFNATGQITSLPEGSFDASHITSAGDNAFRYFNSKGALINLPDSFTMSSVLSTNKGYYVSFNSPNYTINKKVSDLVSGITVPESDMDTFSDNQPGRCGVHENWLVTTADACSISYDDGKGGTGEFKYTADTTGVEVGSGITLPTVEGYIFGGWYTASGDRVDEVSFPELDGQTLYARWVDNVDPIVSADKDGVWWNEDIDITLTVVDDNLDYAKYSRVSSGDCVSNGTNFGSGDVITYSAEGTGTLYLCASDVAGNIGTWSGTYYLDKTRPVITFDQQSGSAAHSHSVEITATDTLSKLKLESNINGITTNADGSKTVLWDGINLTIAGSDLSGVYMWGTIDPLEEYPEDEYLDYEGVDDNAWGGADDRAENGFNSGLNPARQGSCDTGWHVPSAGEWSDLIIAWCNISEDCSPKFDLYKNDDGLYILSSYEAKESLALDLALDVTDDSDVYYRRSSTPHLGLYSDRYYESLYLSEVSWGYPNIRCFKDVTEESSALKYRWQTGSTCSSNENDYTSKFRDAYDETNTTVTTTVSTQGLSDGSYYLCVLSGSVEDNAGNVNMTAKTSGQFIVDNTTPIVSADKAGVWWNDNIAITLTAVDDNLDYAKYSWTSTGDCVSNGTSFSNGDTITYSTEGSGKLYLCASDVAGNTATWSGTYYLDKVRPTITFDQQSGAAAHSHSVEITASDILSKLAVDVSCWSGLGIPPEETYASGVVYGCDGGIPVVTIYGDDGKGITIKAMNEGTGEVTIGSLNDINSYGSLYQWGNNYGFPSSVDTTTPITSLTTPVSAEGYAPGTYSSETWITRDYRDTSDNRNLWGGSGDEKNKNGWWGYDTTRFSVVNASDRQAMCPDGYHIPSMGEWNMLLNLWGNNSGMPAERYWGDLYRIVQTSAGTKFSEDMQIPFVGYRYNYDYGSHSGVYGYYWTSSPNDWNRARHFHISTDALYGNESANYRGYGYAVRCFKNSYIDFISPSSEAISLTLKYRWQADSTCSSNESDYTAMSRDSYSEANLTATATVTTSGLDDGNYYLCVLSGSISDNAGNVNVTTKTQGTFIVDNTAPIVSADKDGVWWNEDFDITLTAIDDNLDYAKYSRTSASDCVTNGTSFSNGDTITYSTEGAGTLYLCVADRVGSTATWSGVYYLDKTDPVCGTWIYEPPLNTWTNGTVTATLTGSTDATAGIQTGGGSCTITTNNATCTVTISDKAGRTTVCTSSGATNIDFEVPTATITTTSTLKTGTQTATLSCSDNVGVTSYYWGTNAAPSLGDYTNVTSTTSFTTTKNVTSAGTYYLYCKDAAGNISTGASQTYYSYTVHNMQNAIDKSEGAYNTTNYPEVTTYTKTYIAPAGTTITFANVYTVPTYSAVNQYKGWSLSASTTAPTTSESETLNGNQVYYFWFDRTKYNLKMTKNTGIATIYYKINGATDWSSTTATKTVSMKAGSTAFAYAVASNGYTCAVTCKSSTTPQTYSAVTAAKTYSPTATATTYTITYNLNGGTESKTNPTTYKVTTAKFGLYQPTKTGAMFLGWTGSNGNEINANIYIPLGSTGNRVYNAVWGSFENIDAYFISETGAVSYITLMDRNMGASSDVITSTDSYGFHYQWGNNNGFQIGCWTDICSDDVTANATTTRVAWNNGYNNKGYNGTVFIKGSDIYFSNGNIGGLWGGGDDSESNNWGWDITTSENIINRQGPCPSGYHVPSAGERNNFLGHWAEGNRDVFNNELFAHGMNGYIGEKSFVNCASGSQFRCEVWESYVDCDEYREELDYISCDEEDDIITLYFKQNFNIPYTVYRNHTNSKIYSWYSSELLLSSVSPYMGYVWYGSVYTGLLATMYGGTYSDAYSVRCFSNDYMFTSPSMTIHPNGGTGAMILVEGGNIKSLGTPKRANSKFEGWYSNVALTTAVTTGNTAPANLYAKWSCNAGYVQNVAGDGCTKIYTITYNLNGGTNNANNPAKYTVESGAITLQSPTKVGYTFLGWTGSNGSISQLSVTIPAGSTGDRIYNATWQSNTYNISYTMNGGTNCGTAPTTATYDTPFTVCNNPTKVGYTFAGWKITGMDSVTHTYGSSTTTSTSISSTKETSFKNLHSTSGATVTFTAQWTINQYNVTLLVNEEGWGTLSNDISGKYDYGAGVWINTSLLGHLQLGSCTTHVGGTNSINDPVISTLSAKAIPGGGSEGGVCKYTDATPTTSTAQYTYDFSGWNNECGGTVTHDCTITAEFTRTLNSYDVTFNSNGGTPTPATQNIAYGSKATKPADPIRTGYAFAGWRLNGSDFDFNTEITGTINLVAMWNLVGYTITYNLNGGTETTSNPTSYTIESGAITLVAPSRTGYTFLGWTGTNGSVAENPIIIPAGSTGNRIYNATWQANTNTPYTVYHYVKKVGSGAYELALTEPKQGTSDAILTLSSLARADGFVCAIYDRGSLTGTENGPGEIVTQTIIRGDGSTKIYLYYTRNNRTVHLSGDEHIDYLEIDGVVDDEAVRECGSEVPVNAIPKPGYHFVRWRERERTEEEEEEEDGNSTSIPTHSGGSND